MNSAFHGTLSDNNIHEYAVVVLVVEAVVKSKQVRKHAW